MDILRPEIICIDGYRFRRNPKQDKTTEEYEEDEMGDNTMSTCTYFNL